MQVNNSSTRIDELKLNDPRFDQLMDLARDGDEAAVADLWHEYGYDFHAAAEQDCLMDEVDRLLCGVKA